MIENEPINRVDSLTAEQVNSFGRGLDEALSRRLEDIAKRQNQELEKAKHGILIEKTLFEIQVQRSLDDEDKKSAMELANAYCALDLGENDE
jgi:hypothetical protein